jgi:glyoxylase-like metal-dependent hydrolase (beta-lactamase superfamily II)
MLKTIYTTSSPGGESVLLLSDQANFLVETGFPFAAQKTLENVKRALAGKPLDYILLTHAHYDHCGGLPVIKEAFPAATVVASQATSDIIGRPGAREFMKKMDKSAAEHAGLDCGGMIPPFPKVDIIVQDGDIIDPEGEAIQVIYTPGHTRDSTAFFFTKEKLLISTESIGVMMERGDVHAAFIVSYKQSLEGIEKLRALKADKVILPHGIIVEGAEVALFFEKAKEANELKAGIIMDGKRQGLSVEEIIDRVKNADYFTRTEADQKLQPEPAYDVNLREAIPRLFAEVQA